ncbi:B-type lectin plumieribetin-like [Conger conger]|uniref:B-type lectin plumieribetin-like n=1 Tax=Conger conger TaxID=82655 RepID=UPI002A5A7249|nr:B-type lectin plumieribetin-like [Conger conger]
MSRNYLSKNDELRKGDYLISNNQEFKAVFQEDGNFVIYGWKPIWASNTVSQEAHRLCMQHDCNFVMYDRNDSATWHTNTYRSGTNVCRVRLQDDGTLVVDVDNKEVWTSAK